MRPATLRGPGPDQVLVLTNGVGELHEPELNKSYNLRQELFLIPPKALPARSERNIDFQSVRPVELHSAAKRNKDSG